MTLHARLDLGGQTLLVAGPASSVGAAVAAACLAAGAVAVPPGVLDAELLVLVAAGGSPAPFAELDEAAWAAGLAATVDAAAQVCRAVVPGMVERGRGSIVTVVPAGGGPALVGATAGLVGLTKALARELALKGIRASSVRYREGAGGAVGASVAFLLSPGAGYVTGATLEVG